jgi:4-hydroxybenzoate polyprenyltransferase/phosphoserine phosphatase
MGDRLRRFDNKRPGVRPVDDVCEMAALDPNTDPGTTADPAPAAASGATPIVVDLDGTLTAGDTLHEQLAVCLFASPLALFGLLAPLFHGRAAFKAALADRELLTAESLPLRDDLVAWLRGEAAKGREIHLCTAAHQTVAETLARRIGIFASVAGSGERNLKGSAKAELLARRFPQGFCYAGDSRADLAVWRAADAIILAGASPGVGRAARRLGKPVEAEFARRPLTLREALAALRVHHWSKNALIFVPLILGHVWRNAPVVIDTTLGLLCLLLATSATYLLNDIADLEADRRHWSKRHRALASGRLSIAAAFGSAVLLLAAALLGAFALSREFALTLSCYVVLTLAYSLGLKRIPLLDTLIIGILFTLRLIMGIALATHDYSEWLLMFSVFFFFSLAVAKRHAEIVQAGEGVAHALDNRGYRVGDAPLSLVFGVASAVASLVIMALFIVDQLQQRNLYAHPSVLWGIPLVLSVWLGRVWLLAHRGELSDDPVSFALSDGASLALGGAVAVIFVAAL